MSMLDSYSETLEQIVNELESLYSISNHSSSGDMTAFDIVDLLSVVGNDIQSCDNSRLETINKEAYKRGILLSSSKDRLDYYNKVRLNFAEYPFMDEVAKVLLQFTNSASLTSNSYSDINKIIELLNYVDANNIKNKFALEYRYLRIFIVLVVYQNFFTASVIANLILKQQIIRG